MGAKTKVPKGRWVRVGEGTFRWGMRNLIRTRVISTITYWPQREKGTAKAKYYMWRPAKRRVR